MTVSELKADVVRVARTCGRPDGMAPSINQYKLLGAVDASTLRAMVGTYKARGLPELSWAEAMEKLGFTPARKWRGTRRPVKYVPCEACHQLHPVQREADLEDSGQYVAEGVLS